MQSYWISQIARNAPILNLLNIQKELEVNHL